MPASEFNEWVGLYLLEAKERKEAEAKAKTKAKTKKPRRPRRR